MFFKEAAEVFGIKSRNFGRFCQRYGFFIMNLYIIRNGLQSCQITFRPDLNGETDRFMARAVQNIKKTV